MGHSRIQVAIGPSGRITLSSVRELQELTGETRRLHSLTEWEPIAEEFGLQLVPVVEEPKVQAAPAAGSETANASVRQRPPSTRSVVDTVAATAGDHPADVLAAFDRRWRTELGRVSLVAELEVTAQEIRTALRCVGHLWEAEYGLDHATHRLRTHAPAAYVVSVAGAASMLLEGGKVLEQIVTQAGIRPVQGYGRAMGTCFLNCLRDLRLATFPQLDTGASYRFVNRMLMHGGVPLDHLDEWFNVAEAARRRLGDVSRTALQADMVERAEEGRLYGATKAVARFLQYGEAFAADFLDRSLDLLDRVRDGDGIDDLDVGLPRRYLERAIELREQGALPAVGRARSRASEVATRPEVRFDPYVLGVHLLLPSVAAADGSVTWVVDVQGEIHRHVARPARAGLPTPTIEVPLPPKVATVQVARDLEEPVAVRVVDLDDPHILFDELGRRIERSSRLSAAPTWSVRPGTVAFDTPPLTEPKVIERHDNVARWPGWVADLLDLSGATELVMESGRKQAISKDESARLEEEVVDGVRTDGGMEVLSAWPRLVLPGGADGAQYRLMIEDLERHGAGAAHDIPVGSDGLTIDLADLVSSGLVGRPVRIRARGPLGRSVRREAVVLPGLAVLLTPVVRTIAEGALVPTRVEVYWDGGGVEPFVMNRDERSRAVEVGDATLVVEPSAVSIQHIGPADATGWRTQPLVLDAEEIAREPGSLVIRLPGASAARLEVIDGHGTTVQSFPPDQRPRKDGAMRFDLARLTDTLKATGSLVLAVDSDIWRGRVADLRPSQLCRDIQLHGARGIIEFLGVGAEGVQAAVYSRLAPLAEPAVIDVPKGTSQTPIPERLLGLGPMRVLLRIQDPWVPAPWPLFPSLGVNCHDLESDLLDSAQVRAAHPLAGFLGGLDDVETTPTRLGDTLRIFDLAHELRVVQPGSQIRHELAPAILRSPEASAIAALDVELDGAKLARIYVSTGLAAALWEGVHDPDVVDRLWSRWPAAGLLACGRIGLDSPLEQLVTSRCGPAAGVLLRGGGHVVLSRPKLDFPAMLEWEAARLQVVRGAAGIAPRYLLDEHSRVDDGFFLIGVLKDPARSEAIAGVAREAESLVGYFLERVLPGSGAEILAEGIRDRFQAPGWQALPAASLTAATAARIAARRGDATHGILTSQARRAMSALAHLSPVLLAADLIMAELTLQGIER